MKRSEMVEKVERSILQLLITNRCRIQEGKLPDPTFVREEADKFLTNLEEYGMIPPDCTPKDQYALYIWEKE